MTEASDPVTLVLTGHLPFDMLDRVVFVVDRRTDEALLAETFGDRRAGVFRLGSVNGRQLRQFLRALAAAAAPIPAVAA